MTQHAELTGGAGAAQNYRPPRYRARDLVGAGDARLEVEGESFPLRDLSMNGLSFWAGPEKNGWTPERAVRVTLRIDGELDYEGQARIARAERAGGRTQVALQLLDGFLDLPVIRRRAQERTVQRQLAEGPGSVRAKVPPAYREAVERATHFVCHYRDALGRREALLRELGHAGRERMRDLEPRTLEAVRPEWNDIRAQAEQAAQSCFADRETLAAAKRYTEAMLTPLLLGAPVVHRSYTKPLGYAGDFETMRYIYRNALEGPDALSRIFHRLACDEPLAAGVRTRKTWLEELQAREYARFVAGSQPGETFRVSSVGAGPAREVAEFVERDQAWPRAARWTLVDQEETALSLAYDDVYRRVSVRRLPVQLQCMYLSMSQLVRSSATQLGDEPQHLVYLAGLFDYLPEAHARAFVATLYRTLAPGGLLAVGNAAGPNEHRWFGEFVLDWPLLFRTEAEVRALARDLPDDAEVEVVQEPVGAYHFLLVRRP